MSQLEEIGCPQVREMYPEIAETLSCCGSCHDDEWDGYDLSELYDEKHLARVCCTLGEFLRGKGWHV